MLLIRGVAGFEATGSASLLPAELLSRDEADSASLPISLSERPPRGAGCEALPDKPLSRGEAASASLPISLSALISRGASCATLPKEL